MTQTSGVVRLTPKGLFSVLSAVGIVQISALTVGLLNAIVLARWLGPDGRGKLAFLMLIVQLVVIITEFGLPNATTTFILRAEHSIQKIFSASCLLAIIRIGIAGITIMVISLYWRDLRSQGFQVIGLVWVGCVLEIALSLSRNVLFGVGNYSPWAFLQVGTLVLCAIFSFLSWFLSLSKDPVYAFIVLIFSRSIGLAATYPFVIRHVRIFPKFDVLFLKELLTLGAKNALNNVVWILGARVDLYTVGFLLSPLQLGIYSIATGLVDKLQGVLMTLPQALYPSQSTGVQSDEAENITARGMRLTITFGVVIILSTSIGSPFVIPVLFGKEYSPTVVPLIILSINTVMFSLFHFLGGYMSGRRMQPQISAIFGSIMMLINIVGNFLLIPQFGLIGSACASLLGTSVALILFTIYFTRITNISISDLFLIRSEDIMLVTQLRTILKKAR